MSTSDVWRHVDHRPRLLVAGVVEQLGDGRHNERAIEPAAELARVAAREDAGPDVVGDHQTAGTQDVFYHEL